MATENSIASTKLENANGTNDNDNDNGGGNNIEILTSKIENDSASTINKHKSPAELFADVNSKTDWATNGNEQIEEKQQSNDADDDDVKFSFDDRNGDSNFQSPIGENIENDETMGSKSIIDDRIKNGDDDDEWKTKSWNDACAESLVDLAKLEPELMDFKKRAPSDDEPKYRRSGNSSTDTNKLEETKENQIERTTMEQSTSNEQQRRSSPPKDQYQPSSMIKKDMESTPPKNSSPTPGSSSSPPESVPLLHHKVKWIRFGATNSTIPIVTQNANGPCPLLALINVLLLRGQARLESNVYEVSSATLLQILHDCIIRMTPQQLSPKYRADYQKNVDDALSFLANLQRGIDVNVRFTGVDQFEHTPDYLVFDLLNIPLYHGWLVEEEDGPVADAIGQLNYNMLIEFIINTKGSGDQTRMIQATLAEEFLDATSTQLTYRGLCELNSAMKDNELAVFFRNNHFSTLVKHGTELFCLITDQGFLNESRMVWESLNSVDGDSQFVDMEFLTVPPKPASVPTVVDGAAALPPDASPQEQLDHDLMVALTLEEQEKAGISDETINATAATGGGPSEESDRLLALKLQQEEDQLAAAQEQRQGTPTSAAAAAGGGTTAGTSSFASSTSDAAAQSDAGGGSTMAPRGRTGSRKDPKCRIM